MSIQTIKDNETNYSVLLVDDDLSTLAVAEAALKKHGFEVEIASNGQQAIDKCGTSNFDACVLDARMPQLNGFETCEQIRQIEEYQKTPVIMATGFEEESTVQRVLDVGATDYYAKPMNFQLLAHRLKLLISEAQLSSMSKSTIAETVLSEIENSTDERRKVIQRLLRKDLELGQLQLYFQPKFATNGLSLTGVECLIRWPSAQLGMVPPSEFIPVAESSSDLMELVNRFVIQASLKQMRTWIESGKAVVPMSINLDGEKLKSDTLVEQLVEQINAYKIPPNLIEVEVTESIMIDANSSAISNLEKLREAGIKIAMDDFGTGYSSLSYLQKLPLDTLKIDMSFVREIHTNETSAAIAKAIINIGHDIGLHVIAEGVETNQQLEMLQAMGCDSIQGYLTGKPVTALEFDAFFTGAQIAA
jgi:EAL domain-containing protein (putative c-di-GMP-specific phosphodiesterase class I)/DNA-binding NarL/FixJ family response regulator